MNKSKRFDYLASNYEMDLTNLERLPTDTGIPLLDRLNAELNAQSESIEDMFIEIACENMDNPRKCAFYKELRKKRSVAPVIPASDKEDIREFYRTGRHSKTELQELYGLKLKELNGIIGTIDRWAIENQVIVETPDNTDTVEEDDFDPNNADYLAILAEVQNNPRD
tara:strand:- start:36 stop:536 length:501 start_codon:yes stop_codon:yes gene_type:complete